MGSIFTLIFWKDALERAIKTAAQFVVGALGADQFFNLFALDLTGIGGVALGGLGLSILTSIISAPFSNQGTGSLTG
jgi:hypothetical protein